MASSRSDAQRLLLPRNVCVHREKHTGSSGGERHERKGEWRGMRRSLTYSSLPCKRAAAIQMSQNPYASARGGKLIARQIFWRRVTVDDYRQVQRNFANDSVSEKPIIHRDRKRVGIGRGQRSKVQQVATPRREPQRCSTANRTNRASVKFPETSSME